MNTREQKLHDEALHMIGVSVSLRIQPQIEAIERTLATLQRALVGQDKNVGILLNALTCVEAFRKNLSQTEVRLDETVRRVHKMIDELNASTQRKKSSSKAKESRPDSVIGGIRIKSGKRGPLMGSKGAEKIRRAQQRRWKKAKRR